MNNNNKLNKLNTARAPNIKADSLKVKEVVDFAERLGYVLELKINKLRAIMQKSNTHLEADTSMIRIQVLEWVQGQIQDIILNNVTTDWPVYDK
jgi:inosine/xanthosine triphosphate pyrophosphatase family protein